MTYAIVIEYEDRTTETKLIDNKRLLADRENPCVNVFKVRTHELCVQWLKRYHNDEIRPDTLNLAEWEHIIIDISNVQTITINNVNSDLHVEEPIKVIYSRQSQK